MSGLLRRTGVCALTPVTPRQSTGARARWAQPRTAPPGGDAPDPTPLIDAPLEAPVTRTANPSRTTLAGLRAGTAPTACAATAGCSNVASTTLAQDGAELAACKPCAAGR